MLTREEILFIVVETSWGHGPSCTQALWAMLDNDKAQRSVIEQQAQVIEAFEKLVKMNGIELTSLIKENQALREKLRAIVKIRFLLGNDPKLNPAYEMADIAQQALKERNDQA